MKRLHEAIDGWLARHPGESMRSLSLRADLNPNSVQHIINGRVKNPRVDTVRALGRVMRIKPGRLIDD